MTPKRFFRSALLLPVIVPLALLPFEPTSFSTLLWTAPVVGGLPYLVFAGFLFVWLGRLRSLGQSHLLSLCAPPLFLPFLGLYLVFLAWTSTPSTEAVSRAWGLTLDLSGFTLVVGYFYVAFANAVALFLKWRGVLQDTNPDN